MVTVQRYMTVSDGMGGYDSEWVDYLELDGTLDQLSADEILATEKLGTVSSHVFITFDIVDVKRTDRFIIDNEIYRITNVDNPNNLNHHLEIILEYTGDSYEV